MDIIKYISVVSVALYSVQFKIILLFIHISYKYMLTLVFGMPVSKVNRSIDFCLITKEITGDCEHGFVFKHVFSTLQVTFTS